MNMRRNGFTIVELAVVLTIIGLLVGVVVGGQSLIAASKLRSIQTDVASLTGAIRQFNEKYQYLPGDFPQGSTTWGIAVDGDGNGRVGTGYTALSNEWWGAWVQLEKAGFLENIVIGGPGSRAENSGAELPLSKIKPGMFLFTYVGTMTNSTDLYNGEYGNALILGSLAAGGSWPDQPLYPVLTTFDAQKLDTKFDDGLPALGNVRAFVEFTSSWGQHTCTTGSSASAGTSAKYNLSSGGSSGARDARCGIVFLTGF